MALAALAAWIIAEADAMQSPAPDWPYRGRMPTAPALLTPELKQAFRDMRRRREETDEAELTLLVTARETGWTWRLIAAVMELGSAQAAQQRHDRLAFAVRRRREAGIPADLR